MLAAIKRHADSDAEPDCLCYHVVRNGFNSDQLSVFEGYNLPAGATVHVSSEPFKVFVDSGLLVGYDVQCVHRDLSKEIAARLLTNYVYQILRRGPCCLSCRRRHRGPSW